MDNAAYHLIYGNNVPTPSKIEKMECIAYLESKQVRVDPEDTLAILKNRSSNSLWKLRNEKQ